MPISLPRAAPLVAALLLAAAAHAQAPAGKPATDAELVALVRAAVKAEDTGDPDSGRFYAPTQAITDAIEPFHWHGPDAHRRWLQAVATDFETRNRSNGSVTLADPSTVRVSETAAYLVFPASFAFTEKGELKSQPVTFTVSLTRLPEGWKIASWTWSGSN